ncbi:O-antigen ligase family protein [Miniphocaeibacter halophilus]|uniref:O-antigen ligase family protein n=1 Tax=Miniphocaeibacter halophilus TaxID=2931922 RepID=A0AC61MS82_9FIRM|nr:O-antigen ligase family protein [Miniphocaeibacter halophilus]QQK08467.1 O-antigen ligase family protein [Miniphocaeibacter halophilus]
MKRTILDNDKYYYLFSSILLITISLLISELGVGLKILDEYSSFKIGIILASAIFLLAFIINPINMSKNIFYAARNQLKEIGFLFILIILYVIFGILSFYYTKNMEIAIIKYENIAYMLLLLFLYLLYLNRESVGDKLNTLLKFLSLPSIVIIPYTWIYLLIFKRTYYSRRLSLLRDYNDFGVLLLFSFVALVFLIFRNIKNLHVRNVLLIFTIIVGASTIYLIASRRSSLLLGVIVIMFLLYAIYDNFKKIFKENIKKSKLVFKYILSLLLLFLTVAIAYVGSVFVTYSYNYLTTEMVVELTENKDSQGIRVNRDVEEILYDEKAFDKREFLWGMAIDSYMEYPMVNKIIGGGASAQVDIYNEPENKLLRDKEYGQITSDNTSHPHNFLLTELLTGGAVLLLLTIVSLIVFLKLLFNLGKKSLTDAFFIFLMSLVILADLFVDSRYGFLGNSYVWVLLILLITAFNSSRVKIVKKDEISNDYIDNSKLDDEDLIKEDKIIVDDEEP